MRYVLERGTLEQAGKSCIYNSSSYVCHYKVFLPVNSEGQRTPPLPGCTPCSLDTCSNLDTIYRRRLAYSCSTSGTHVPLGTHQWRSKLARRALPCKSEFQGQICACHYNKKFSGNGLFPSTVGTTGDHTCLASLVQRLCRCTALLAIEDNTHLQETCHETRTAYLRHSWRGRLFVPHTPLPPCMRHRQIPASPSKDDRGEASDVMALGGPSCLISAPHSAGLGISVPAIHKDRQLTFVFPPKMYQFRFAMRREFHSPETEPHTCPA